MEDLAKPLVSYEDYIEKSKLSDSPVAKAIYDSYYRLWLDANKVRSCGIDNPECEACQ